jgi:hypothetical protein
MATTLRSDSRRLYSWWWDSHISPKSSKWLQENLTDMDGKVKAMIKLIEEDADSFARRAEMYYKKRPELMKLVEEFYRAYRALAERYDHATFELRQVHHTMSEAFPNLALPDGMTMTSSSPSADGMEPPAALLNEMGIAYQQYNEGEVEKLKKAVDDLKMEKEDLVLRCQESLEKLCSVEIQLRDAQNDISEVNVQASEARDKVFSLKDALVQLEAERDAIFSKYEESLVRLSTSESENSQLESEKISNSQKISDLENAILIAEENSRLMEERAVRAESDIFRLEEIIAKLKDERESASLKYEFCLVRISKLENELFSAQEEVKRLNDEILNGVMNLKNAEENSSALEKSNEFLRLEADNLIKKIAAKDQELCMKHDELEKLEDLKKSYKALMEQVEFSGLNPDSFGSSVKELQEENCSLRKVNKKKRDENETLSKKLDSFEQVNKNNASLQNSLLNVEGELTGLKEDFKFLHDEKSTLLSQLQVSTENTRILLEKNTGLEESLSHANFELGSLREKVESLDELCKLLATEKSNLATERSSLLIQLEKVEKRLQNLESKFTDFEANYGEQEEKEFKMSEIKELRAYLAAEKEERKSLSQLSGTRFSCLEERINLLQEESKLRGKEFKEEIDKAVIAQFEIFVLQKFIQDMEEKNCALLFELHKHAEESKLTDQLISELEGENLDQQVETELLLVEIKKLKLGIYNVFRVLEGGSDFGAEEKFENEQISVQQIVGQIENLKISLSKYENEIKNLYAKQNDLLDENMYLEKENDSLVLETLAFDNLWTILKSFEVEHGEELRRLSEESSNLHMLNNKLKAEVFKLSSKLEMNETEYSLLKISADRLALELRGAQDFNEELKIDLVKEKKANLELCKTVKKMKVEYEESQAVQGNEIRYLHEEINERKIREENLNSELEEINNEFELWEAEASSFRFDLHISAVRELLYKDKVHELNGICTRLEAENISKSREIGEMNEKLLYKDNEIRGLDAQLKAYDPVIDSLKKNMESLEQNTLSLTNLIADNDEKSKVVEIHPNQEKDQDVEIHNSPNGISDLQSLQTSIKSVENAVLEEIERHANPKPEDEKTVRIRLTRSNCIRSPVRVKGKEKQETGLWYELENYHLNSQNSKPEVTKNGAMMRDIPLDLPSNKIGNSGPFLELWESMDKSLVPSSTTDYSKENKKGAKILQRLASDAQKLTTIQTAVYGLKMKLETTNKKGQKGNYKGLDLVTVKEQVEEAEESVSLLFELNDYLVKNIKEDEEDEEDGESEVTKRVLDQAKRGSEKIGRLQLEVEKMEYLLMRFDEIKKGKKGRFLKTKSVVILRDFVHGGKKKKKSCISGCFKAGSSSFRNGEMYGVI